MVTTRVAGPADVEAMAELWVAANHARKAETGLALGPVAGGDAEAEVRKRLADPAFAVLAEDDGDLLAMAIFVQARARDGRSPEPVPGLAHVSMVAVRPSRWGQGLGEVVMVAAQRAAPDRGFPRAQLWTHETNRRAQRLYERLGWVASGRTTTDDNGETIRHYEREL
ncbi:MAG: GNAT family N-acetyltransferase [Actinoplanes sp.]